MGALNMDNNYSDDAIQKAGLETINQEIDGLEALKEVLDDRFVETVRLVFGLKGRLIVTGMGKSGHIARKIAATMASTGTPAHFVHPGEASHGDLGMITQDDAVMMLSNSGETRELEDMIGYCSRFSIPMIGIARRKTSMLLEASDIPLLLPEIPESSPTGAPTTSTTMMLAYGDAISMALLEMRGFNKQDFGVYHPGGKLGQGLLRVRSLMHDVEALPLVSEGDNMQGVLVEITSKSFGCAGVTNALGELVGVITDGDLRRHMGAGILEQKASEVMTKNPVATAPNLLATEALAVMNDKKITSLFVVDEGKPVGLIHIHDCLRAGVA